MSGSRIAHVTALALPWSSGRTHPQAQTLQSIKSRHAGIPNTTNHTPAGRAGTFELWQLDQTSQESVDNLIKRMKDTYGQIDFLFLNAGGALAENIPLQICAGVPEYDCGWVGCAGWEGISGVLFCAGCLSAPAKQ